MLSQPDASQRRRHLIIAGTGRAGTTFLVRYLTALGLDTHLSRRGSSAWLDEDAQAGLEDFPFGPDAADLPYLIKNPMLHEFIDQVIESDAMTIDGVIIPVRSLRDATSSRVVLERRSMAEHLPWLQFMDKAWDSSGNVPGGLIFSLNALDEARILAMGFHLLVERLVRAGIPMVFLDFPRIVIDGQYLFDQLHRFLPPAATAELALSTHAALADPEKARIERETSAQAAAPPAMGDAKLEESLDRIALLREIARLRRELAKPAAVQTEEQTFAQQRDTVIGIITAEAARLRVQIEELEKLRARGSAEIERLRDELAGRDELERRNAELARAFSVANEQLDIEIKERAALEVQCHKLERAVTDARNRVIAAEHALHVYLAPFADDRAFLATPQDGTLVLETLRQRMTAMLDQLESANAELAAVSSRLADFERLSGTSLIKRLLR